MSGMTFSRHGPIPLGAGTDPAGSSRLEELLGAGPTLVQRRPISAQEVLRATLRRAWDSDPALQSMRGSLQGVGQRISPTYQAVAERTGYGVELKREALRAGVSDLMRSAWTPPPF
jgi:hypothetical protein